MGTVVTEQLPAKLDQARIAGLPRQSSRCASANAFSSSLDASAPRTPNHISQSKPSLQDQISAAPRDGATCPSSAAPSLPTPPSKTPLFTPLLKEHGDSDTQPFDQAFADTLRPAPPPALPEVHSQISCVVLPPASCASCHLADFFVINVLQTPLLSTRRSMHTHLYARLPTQPNPSPLYTMPNLLTLHPTRCCTPPQSLTFALQVPAAAVLQAGAAQVRQSRNLRRLSLQQAEAEGTAAATDVDPLALLQLEPACAPPDLPMPDAAA